MGHLWVGKVGIKIAVNEGGEVQMFCSNVGNVAEVLSWIITWRDIGSDEEPLMFTRCENCRDSVGGDQGGVVNVPVVGIIVPEEHDATFMHTGCTGGQDIVCKLKSGVFVRGDLGFCEDAQIKV